MKHGQTIKRNVKPPVFFVLCFILFAVLACENSIIRDQLQPLMDTRTKEGQTEGEPTVNIYTVTFNSMGGTSINPISNVSSHTGITKPADPIRPGFGLDGWFKDLGLTDEWNFAEDTVTENITLYAKWTRNTLEISIEMETIANIHPVFPPPHRNKPQRRITVLPNRGDKCG